MASELRIHPIYREVFNEPHPADLERLRSSKEELLFSQTTDFVDNRNWESTARRVALIFLKIAFFPWGLYSAVRWGLQRLLMIPIYPAQSGLVKILIPQLGILGLDYERRKGVEALSQRGHIVRHVRFEKDGKALSGVLITHPDYGCNGKWAIQACGNLQPYEIGMEKMAAFYHRKEFSLLLLNNPGVGRSEGESTPQTIGETQEMGIRFLESALKAKKVVMAGFSLGGGAIGQAILRHAFQPDIKYLAIRQMSFGRVSSVCEKRYREFFNAQWLERLIAPLVRWVGCEMDSVEASRYLQKNHIPEVIIQRGDSEEAFDCDGAIPKEATLGHTLHEEGITHHKLFIRLPKADHIDIDFIGLATERALEEIVGGEKTPFRLRKVYDSVTRPLISLWNKVLQ